jgi:hypothetical protein
MPSGIATSIQGEIGERWKCRLEYRVSPKNDSLYLVAEITTAMTHSSHGSSAEIVQDFLKCKDDSRQRLHYNAAANPADTPIGTIARTICFFLPNHCPTFEPIAAEKLTVGPSGH